jgi:SAM-dependent methyltransferase
VNNIAALIGQTDIYLLDQIMKGRYTARETRILDAGAGAGRNLHWFAEEGFEVYGTDRDPAAVEALRERYPGLAAETFQVAAVEDLPFPDAYFQHVISSAVLHFADSEAHFERMFGEMVRVLRPGGSLFIRMTTDVGLTQTMLPLGQGRFALPDGTARFLLTRPMLERLMLQHGLQWLEPFKTVLVDGVRSMAVVVLMR